MIVDWIISLGPWAWCVLGLILLLLEVLAPGFVFLWFGIAAMVVGGLAFLVDMSWQVELIVFIVLSVVSLLAGRSLMAKLSPSEGDPRLNNRGSRYVGREFVLAQPLSKGEGKLSIDDTVWRISGPDLPAGSSVRVVAVDGVRLQVEAAE